MGTISVGKGIYKINGKNLYLKFRKDSLTYDSTAKITKKEETEDKNVTLKLKVVDHYGQPLAAVDIKSEHVNPSTASTNPEGELIIQDIPKSNEPIFFTTPNLLGFENFEFNFIPLHDATVYVTLSPQKPKIISDQTFIFEIVTSTPKKLVLKNSSGHVQEFISTD